MKIIPRLNSVYYRLIGSYIVLIVITTILLGAFSFHYFSSIFKEELLKVNQQKLTHLKYMEEETIFRRAEQLYASLAIDNKNSQQFRAFIEDYPKYSNEKISSIYTDLKNIVSSNYDWIDSIEIYNKEQQTVISSAAGVKFLERNSSKSWIHFNWLSQFDTLDTPIEWLNAPQFNANDVPVITLIGSLPINMGDSPNNGFIAIHVKPDAIHNLILEATQNAKEEILLVTNTGELISESGQKSELSSLGFMWNTIFSSQGQGHDIKKINGVTSMITYTNLNSNGWALVDIMPIDEFYKKSDAILRFLLLFCGISIAIGLILSNIFTWNIYNPLKRILESTKRIFIEPSTKELNMRENEFHIINNVINNLSIKVNDLESTIHTNKPLIKYNLVSGLLNKTIISMEELEARLRLLHQSLEHPFFVSMIVQFDENQHGKLSEENSQFIIYRLIDYIEEHSDSEHTCIATQLAERQVAVILNSNKNPDKFVHHVVRKATGFVQSNFMINISFMVGECADTPFELHHSFITAKSLIQYQYFFPDTKLFTSKFFLEREQSQEQLPEKLYEEFLKSLKIKSMGDVRQNLSKFFATIRNGNYSAKHCHQAIIQLTSIFHSYMKNSHLDSSAVMNEVLVEELRSIRNIDEFEQWILHIIQSFFDLMQDDANSRTHLIINNVKSYIANHLNEELSLNSVAEHVMLNPSYLSKLFKNESGINFVDYVNKQRMNKARELVLTTDYNIEEIARQVGFNSSTYFIKKFKEMFGSTPRNYKMNQIRRNSVP